MTNKIRIAKTFTFHAAHSLPNHEGECANLHGHTFKMLVEVSGCVNAKEGAENGMVMDFSHLKEMVEDKIISPFCDHKNLNDFDTNPTSENLVCKVAEILRLPLFKQNVRLQRVRIWETETSYAEWRREDNE